MVAKVNNRRIYPDANHQPMQDAKFRKDEAKERQEYYDTLTLQQKLDALDKKLGVGVGAVKQRARLARLLAQPKHEAPKKEVATHQDMPKAAQTPTETQHNKKSFKHNK